MSSALTGVACDAKCWLHFRPWANNDFGILGMFWSTGCVTSHVVMVPWRYRMANENNPTVRHLQTWDFVENPVFTLGTHLDAGLIMTEDSAEPGLRPRQYVLFSKLDAQFITEGDEFQHGLPNPVNHLFSRFIGFAGAQWMRNALVLRIDKTRRPMDLSCKDKVRISALLYRAFVDGRLSRRGVVHLPRRPHDVLCYSETGFPLEICSMITSMVRFRNRVVLHKMNYMWCCASIMVIKSRIREILTAFFGAHRQAMIHLMRKHQVAIFGSMGRMVMRSGLHLQDNLNLIAGADHGDDFIRSLVAIFGVASAQSRDVEYNKQKIVSKWMEWTIPTGKRFTLGICCHPSFMPTILSAGSTSQMDFVTSDHFVSPYPHLSTHGLSLFSDQRGWMDRYELMGRQQATKLTCIDNNSNWEGLCGYNCPGLVRDVEGLRGFGFMQWGDEANLNWSNVDICWRLGIMCENSDCEHRDNNGTWTGGMR
ncbi:hypothetical protein C8J56DRAFT_1040048 [Mycena floridula]|nr:hypothetical protein C8J56DRAFT_1040048 [Mycena floridula]